MSVVVRNKSLSMTVSLKEGTRTKDDGFDEYE